MTTETKTSDYYLDLMRGKLSPEGDRLYPEGIIKNISGRPKYLETALGLQVRADGIIIAISKGFGIQDSDPDQALDELTNKSLGHLRELLASNSGKPVFVAVAGPGGAGKDTVLENLEDELNRGDGSGVRIGRINKHTTRDSSRPGAYIFASDTEEFHDNVGKVAVAPPEVDSLNHIFGISLSKDGVLATKEMETIEGHVDEDPAMTEWNAPLASGSEVVELIYRKNRGWYATTLGEIRKTVFASDITFVTGNPQNLSNMMAKVGEEIEGVLPIFVYIMPGYPPQFISAGRSLIRDGINQDDEKLLSTTGPRQTDEMQIFSDLLTRDDLPVDQVIVLENDRILSRPGEKIVTEAGISLGQVFQEHFRNNSVS